MLMQRTRELVKQEMDRRRMSLRDFAKTMGISKAKATDFLNGKEPLSTNDLLGLNVTFPEIPMSQWVLYDKEYQEQRKKLEEV